MTRSRSDLVFKLRSVIAAATLLALPVGPVAADHGYWPESGVEPARVSGHRPRTEANSTAGDWGADCATRAASAEGANGLDVYGHVLQADYALAVVLAQVAGEPTDGPYGVTLFRDAKAGQFVWADADGDGAFAGRHEADAGELFLCIGSGMPATDTVAGGTPRPPLPGVDTAWTAALYVTALTGVLVLLDAGRALRGRAAL
jgi:hypothetical protein